MNLANQQLSIPKKRRGAFEGEVDEAGVIIHGQNAIGDRFKFVSEAFLDPSINWGVKIGGASSLAVTSPEANAVSIAKGYGYTKDINPIVVPNIPESWQGNRSVYTGENKYSLHPSTGDILLGTGTFYLSLAYKEYSDYMGAAIADYTPENVKFYDNFFLRAGIDAPASVGGSAADPAAKGSDGSVGSNENDVFIAKITKDGAGAITFESFTPQTITSVITSASEDVWTAHRRQSHIAGIVAPYADRIDEDWDDASQNVNNSLKPTIDAVTDTLINFAVYKVGTVIIIDGDEIPEPSSLSYDAATVLGAGEDGKTYFVYLDSAGAYGLLEEIAGVGLYSFPADKIPLGKFEWDWNGGSPLCVLPADDTTPGVKGIWDERRFGTEGLNRFDWQYRDGMIVWDAGRSAYDNGLNIWIPGKTSLSNYINWWAGDTKPKKKFMKYAYGTNSFVFDCSVFATDFATDGAFLLFNGGVLTITGAGSKIDILSGGEIYVDAGNYLNIKGVLNSYSDLGTIEGTWAGINATIRNLQLYAPEIEGYMNWLTGGVNNFASAGVKEIFHNGGRFEVHDDGSFRLGGTAGTGAGQTVVTGAEAEKLIAGVNSNADTLHDHNSNNILPIHMGANIMDDTGVPVAKVGTTPLLSDVYVPHLRWTEAGSMNDKHISCSFLIPPKVRTGASPWILNMLLVPNKAAGSMGIKVRTWAGQLVAVGSSISSSSIWSAEDTYSFVDGDNNNVTLVTRTAPAPIIAHYPGQPVEINIEITGMTTGQWAYLMSLWIEYKKLGET